MDNLDNGNVDDVIAIAEHEWRSMGIGQSDRTALAGDLRQELTAAAADGVAPRQLLGDDIRAFARNVATEAGTTRMPYEIRRILLAALAGAAPGLAVGWVFLWFLPSAGVSNPADPYVLYGVAPIAILAGALIAVGRMKDVAEIGRTVRAMALLLPIAGILITPVIMGFAALIDYNASLPVMSLEILIAAGALSGATVLARRWALAPALGTARLADPAPR